MVVDAEVVRAIAEDLSGAEIKVFRAAAVAEKLKGSHVKMTSSSFGDQASAGIFVDRDAGEVVAYCNAALDYQAAEANGGERHNPAVNHFDFSLIPSGW
jgi:hypothetical protein